MQVRGNGLAVIDGGLGPHDAEANRARIDVRRLKETPYGIGSERDRIFVRRGHRHPANAETFDVFRRRNTARFSEVRKLEITLRNCDCDRIHTDRGAPLILHDRASYPRWAQKSPFLG